MNLDAWDFYDGTIFSGMSEQLIAGRYRVISELGSGGNAYVYKVLDLNLQKVCALKTLKVLNPTPSQLIRFQREAKALSALSHPNVICVFHFDVTESNQPYLVMEYLEGQTLADKIERSGPLSTQEALIVFTQICDGMAHSHAHNVIHRDLAPANVMLVPIDQEATGQVSQVPFRVVIFDFGLAKIVADDGEFDIATKPGIALGSPPYMSPEHSLGKNLDQRSDIYSLGCIMYETLAGVPPIMAESPVETMSKQITEVAPPLAAKSIEDFPQPLEKLVAKALRKDPARRYQSMDELNAAVGSVWNKLGLGDPPQSETLTVHPKQKPFRPRMLATIAAFPVLAVVGYIATFHIMSKEHQTTPVAPLTVERKARIAIEGADELIEEDVVKRDQNRALMPKHAKTMASEGEQIVLQSLLAGENGSNDWLILPWEANISWAWKMASDEEVKALASKPLESEYVSVYNSSELTPSGLMTLARLPLKGLGLGKLGLRTSELMLFLPATRNIEVLYIEENEGLRDYDLDLITRFKKLRILSLGRCGFTDKGLSRLKGLDNLEILKLDSLGITGSGLSALTALPKMTKLTLTGTKLKPAGWAELAKLKQLKSLNVACTEAQDREILELSGLDLQRLDISRNPVTEKCFKAIVAMKNLKVLRLYNCDKISRAGVEKLKKDRPGIQIDLARQESARRDPLLVY